MKPDKKVLESAVLGLALVLVTTYTAVAAPKQEAAGDSQMRVTSNGTAGAASQLVSGLDDTQTASIEKTDVEVVTAPQMSEEEVAWQNRLMANVEESLNVRTEPNEAAALAGKLRKGDVAEVVERMDGWTHITSGNVDGYVKDEFCVFGQEAYAYAKANCTTKATVLEAGLRLRSEANEASSIYDVVAQGDTLTVAADMEVPEGWVAIQYGDGIAYVSAQYVEVALSTGTGITVEEGRYPKKKNEIMMGKNLINEIDYKVGDYINLEINGLQAKNFLITGTFNTMMNTGKEIAFLNEVFDYIGAEEKAYGDFGS